VLSCNGFEVIDLGVMVSCEDILKAAKEHNADIIGMSGLITPSLDEMIHNAKEMQRQGFTTPLLIGGATTSKAHTAIKIAPHYEGIIDHVGDASLAVGVCNVLLNEEARAKHQVELKAKQKIIIEKFEAKTKATKFYDLKTARAKKGVSSWDGYKPPKPKKLGVRVIDDINLEELVQFIDWSPFFWTWELKGVYPKIFDHEKWGEQAKDLFDDAQKLLADIVSNKRFSPRALVGMWPAASIGDDVEIYDTKSKSPLETFHFLRQQKEKTGKTPSLCPSFLSTSINFQRVFFSL